MIEAKTWVPKEVYWQPPQKKGMGTERPQFSPGKEKASRDQSTPVRMGPEIDKKANSPFEHGPAAAEYMKNRGTSPSQGAKKVKQSSTGSVPYPSPVMSASSMESDRGKQHERHSGVFYLTMLLSLVIIILIDYLYSLFINSQKTY